MRRIVAASALTGGALVAGLVAVAVSVSGLFARADTRGASRIFSVAPGEPVPSVVGRLAEEGLLPTRPLFGPEVLLAFVRISGADREIKSGEYELSPSHSPLEILRRLRSGSIRTVAVTLPEGFRIDEVAERLQAAGVTEARAFTERAMDPQFTRSLNVVAETLEGYLYPETYRFRRDTPAEEVLRTFVDEFWDRWTEEDRARMGASELSLHELVTLASVVEKETAVPEERGVVAGVFTNRLRKGMRLQSDPTVIYGILRTRGAFDGNLRKHDLLEDNPYNTYTRSGLPPGPIANPTIDSIRAALSPDDVPYLYFVSRNDGTHLFSKTLKEHTRAVNLYQRRR